VDILVFSMEGKRLCRRAAMGNVQAAASRD